MSFPPFCVESRFICSLLLEYSRREKAYYFRATAMARMCLVRVIVGCYCADREVKSSSQAGSVADPELGGDHANDASVLCGNWFCGGTLDFQATTSC